MSDKEKLFESVYELVSIVPAGKVVTYGDIATILNINPRYVGYILHHNPYPGKVPCHRVVNSQGRVAATFAFGGDDSQQKLLEEEGIVFQDGKIDLSIYHYNF